MQIANDTVVQFNYTLKDEQGEVMDTNEGKAPWPTCTVTTTCWKGWKRRWTARAKATASA
ncbi:hypothetical protein MBH78_07660 [Oceanimonas sp. NS1]|nr:hypothetical protein [Oceanimonas sp. NS1]